MLIISFDAVGNSEFEYLTRYPAFRAFSEQSTVHREVSTVFLSNTYPVHTSVVTGVVPATHGLLSNTKPFPAPYPEWNSRESFIRAKTLWQAAAEHGIDTATVMWPVTAYSQSIRYNIPEVLAHPGQSQILTSLKAGSKALQIRLFLKHRKLLRGINQPYLDYFSTACMVDILQKHNPGLALIHLTAYDTLCHLYGRGSTQLETAYLALDRNLASLLKAAGKDRAILLFSDHAQINVHSVLDPNQVLYSMKLLTRNDDGSYRLTDHECFIECCGGSAFFHTGKLSKAALNEVRSRMEQGKGFRRFLTPEEMQMSGHTDSAFGFCAQAGYCYDTSTEKKEKANHGYPLDMPDYSVFYMLRDGTHPGSITKGGSLLEIAPLVSELLGFHIH